MMEGFGTGPPARFSVPSARTTLAVKLKVIKPLGGGGGGGGGVRERESKLATTCKSVAVMMIVLLPVPPPVGLGGVVGRASLGIKSLEPRRLKVIEVLPAGVPAGKRLFPLTPENTS
jgi:hypothetical protein